MALRLKAISRQKLLLSAAGMRGQFPDLAPILSGVIDWQEIERQYDEMVKYTAAMRRGTADSEAFLRRFAKAETMHPTYKALAELGRALLVEAHAARGLPRAHAAHIRPCEPLWPL